MAINVKISISVKNPLASKPSLPSGLPAKVRPDGNSALWVMGFALDGGGGGGSSLSEHSVGL